MKIVFLEEVEGSGLVGEVKVVKNGYARNFLLPRGLAVPATKDNLQRAERLAKADAIRQDRLDTSAQGVAKKLDGAALVFEARVGQQGRLFGSVTALNIAERLSELAGESVDHRHVLLGRALRTLGTQDVRIRLTRNVIATISVEVKAEDTEEAAPAEPTIEEAVAAVEAEEEAEAAASEAAAETDAVAAAATPETDG